MRMAMLRAAIAVSLTSPSILYAANDLESRVARLERSNQALQARVRQQDAQIAEQQAALEGTPTRLKRLEKDIEEKRAEPAAGVAESWLDRIEIAGLIEVETSYVSPYEGGSESDITLATAELGIAAQINDWGDAAISFLYEEDATDLEVDIASITVSNPEATPIFFAAGQLYVPFGSYETNLVSDPLTLEIGETRETALQLGFVSGGFSGSAYVFNGDRKIDGENQIGTWGATLGYARESDAGAFALGAGYISDLGDSDTLQEVTNENRTETLATAQEEGQDLSGYSLDPSERIGGWTLNAAAELGRFNLIGEYLAATDSFDMDSLAYEDAGAKTAAWNIEAGIRFDVMGRDSVAAVAYQGTREAVALELPQERWLVGWSAEVYRQTSLSLEWAYDRDYDRSEGGTGETGSTFTAQLAVEF
ncbi:LbtU family siderophore porin [Thiorhodococcus minor]|uniref:LbtU family siderophore porin n=1 Tax=Thiorhodococcus minor TaxID=57489 RepID=A0A6M0JZV7_9GAMM|nr:LbtU family siderophore porin [Thiorhodococcus minor]NEV62213.1 LbtU family siderophore porin [Thiorhodococcus minor]